MGLTRQYRTVRNWVKGQSDPNIPPLKLTKRRRLSFFELVIRGLGGLNSAYALTKDPVRLERSQELGDALLPALSSHTGCPSSSYEVG